MSIHGLSIICLRYIVDPSLGDNIGEGLGREGASPYKAILGRVAPNCWIDRSCPSSLQQSKPSGTLLPPMGVLSLTHTLTMGGYFKFNHAKQKYTSSFVKLNCSFRIFQNVHLDVYITKQVIIQLILRPSLGNANVLAPATTKSDVTKPLTNKLLSHFLTL